MRPVVGHTDRMGISLTTAAGREVVNRAFELAISSSPLPREWMDFATDVFAYPFKTYATALATSLAAKSTDERIDPASLKIGYSDRAFNFRTFGHEVVVPASRELGFSIRATRREPLNNQPFFRYDHLEVVDRSGNPALHKRYTSQIMKLDTLTKDQAFEALAAFLRVARNEHLTAEQVEIDTTAITPLRLSQSIEIFLRSDAPERPKRLQAFGAAALDLAHPNIISRPINDPSRDWPGDVHAVADDHPYLAMEVRGKSVPPGELAALATECASRQVRTVVLFVDWHAHRPLAGSLPTLRAAHPELVIDVYESSFALLLASLAWSGSDSLAASEDLAGRFLSHLREIECATATLTEWASLVNGDIPFDSRV